MSSKTRSPVKILPAKKRTSPPTMGAIRVMGVDPGLTKVGIAVLEREKGKKPRVKSLRMLETPGIPAKKLKQMKMRVSWDDQRRMMLQWDALIEESVGGIHAIGIESYAPFPGQMGHNAWKTSLSFQTACCFARTQGIAPNVSRPDDLKREFIGKNKGGKVQVMGGLFQKIDGLAEMLEEFSPTKWEHLTDACGHAYIAMMKL